MKMYRNLIIALSFVVFFVSFSVISFAGSGHQKMMSASTVKTLKDSAAALQKTNPELSKELTALADQHEKGMMKQKAWRDEQIKMVKDSAAALQTSSVDLAKGLNEYADREMKATEMSDMKGNDAADIKLFRDSAAALQTSNPKLAEKLTMCANKKELKTRWMREEAGEIAEPAAEQKEMGAY
jgi:hypothetical protein